MLQLEEPFDTGINSVKQNSTDLTMSLVKNKTCSLSDVGIFPILFGTEQILSKFYLKSCLVQDRSVKSLLHLKAKKHVCVFILMFVNYLGNLYVATSGFN